MRHHAPISSFDRWRPSTSFCRVSGGTLSLKKARTSSRNASSSLLKLRSIGSSCERNQKRCNREVRPLSLWERAGVRGYGLSIVRNPSPGSLRDPTSPKGRGEDRICGALCRRVGRIQRNATGLADQRAGGGNDDG